MALPKKLTVLPLAARSLLPVEGGVYWISVAELGVVYVGSTVSVRGRWAASAHHRDGEIARLGHAWIGYVLIEDASERAELERSEIARLCPRLNRIGNPGHPSRYSPEVRMDRDYVLVKEAAAELGVSTWAIWKAIQNGQIERTEKIGPLHAIPPDVWERYKARRRPRGRPPKLATAS